MKQALIILLALFSLSANAQGTDTTKLRSGKLTLRANDWEYAATFMAYTETFESLYDSIKIRYRTAIPPSGTTLVSVDSVTNGELVALARVVRSGLDEANRTAVTRIVTAIRAINNSYVNGQIDLIDAGEQTIFTNRRQEGQRRIRKQ